MKMKVNLFDKMNEKEKENPMLLKDGNVVCIGVVNAVEHLNQKKRHSFKTSMWMEIKTQNHKGALVRNSCC